MTMSDLPPLTADDSPGHWAHRGYLDAMAAQGGSEMPWENLSPDEQSLWESAAQSVMAKPAQQKLTKAEAAAVAKEEATAAKEEAAAATTEPAVATTTPAA